MRNLRAFSTQSSLVLLAALLAGPVFAQSFHSKKEEPGENRQVEAPVISLSEADKKKLARGQVLVGVQNRTNGRRWVTAKVKIGARPSVVWDAVHEERKCDPDLAYSKVVEESKNEEILEQKFQLLPIIGTSVCLIRSVELPHKRIDYYLLKSDRFRAVEGSWLLQPTEDGGTVLELGSYIDMGVPAPRSFIEGIAGKKIERRVLNVRRVAELNQSKLAHKSEVRESLK